MRKVWMNGLLAVASGGAIGAVLRYVVSLVVRPETGSFPWHTFGVNALGSFLLGVLMALLPADGTREGWRLFLGVGILGGFTTFSTFSMEAVSFAHQGAPALALGYAFGSLLAGLAAASAGYALGRAI